MKQLNEPDGAVTPIPLVSAASPVTGQSRVGYAFVPGRFGGMLAAMLLAPGLAMGQSQITPGAPSLPLRPQAIANGVGSRITYQYNTEFVTIGAPGNTALMDTYETPNYGRVDYEYRIGRTEITTSQWASFLSAAMGRTTADRLPWLSVPSSWGGQVDPTYAGPGTSYRAAPGRENLAVGGVSWRAAAMYCNWLHNDQGTSRESFLSGAYDVSTFGGVGNVFTDQAAHSPSAKFWIPTMNEWAKAAFYDPNRAATDSTLYWSYQNGTDTVPIYRAPQDGGGANAGFSTASNGQDATQIALMSYVNTQSPWGLMDCAGGTREWTESIYTYNGGAKDRITQGSSWVSTPFNSDRIGRFGGGFPNYEIYNQGFRIAATVPSSSTGAAIVFFLLATNNRRRK